MQPSTQASIIAVGNQKGGVGKTALTFHLSAELARRGRRVLMVDCDPQASLSAICGVEDAERNLAAVLGVTTRGTGDLAPIIRSVADRLALAPSDIALSATELHLVGRNARESQLARALAPVAGQYDFILLDLPPSLGLMTVNGLIAARWALTPVLPDIVSLRGVGLFIDTLRDLRADFPSVAELLGVVVMQADTRPVHAREVLAAISRRVDLRPFTATIPRSVRFADAALARQPISTFDPKGPGALAYAQLAEEVLTRVT